MDTTEHWKDASRGGTRRIARPNGNKLEDMRPIIRKLNKFANGARTRGRVQGDKEAIRAIKKNEVTGKTKNVRTSNGRMGRYCWKSIAGGIMARRGGMMLETGEDVKRGARRNAFQISAGMPKILPNYNEHHATAN